MRQNKIIRATKNGINRFLDGDFFGLAAESSFYLLSAFLPMIIMIFTVASSISLNYTDAMFKVLSMLPKKAANLLISMLASHRESSAVITITTLMSIVSMSGLILVAEKGLIRFYQIENNRSFLVSKFMAVIFAILIYISIIATFGLIIFGRVIGTAISAYITSPQALKIWNISRYIGMFVFVGLVVSVLYKALPTVKLKLFEVIPGAIFATIGWYIASALFALYVNNFPQYEIIYGSLAGFACLIMWIYMTALIILAGAKINALIYRHKMKKLSERAKEN